MFSVSIMIPAVDETDSLMNVIEKTIELCAETYLKEIIVVTCDRTTQECTDIIKNIIAEHPEIRIVHHKQRKPLIAAAMKEAIELACGTHMVQMASDYNTDPTILPNMFNVAKNNPESIVIASRWIEGGGFEEYGVFSKLCNYVFQQMLRLLFDSRIHDYTYSYRIFPIECMKRITWEEKDFPIVLENTLKLIRLGYKFIEIPAVWRSRKQGESCNSFLKKLSYLKTVFKVRFMPLEKIKSDDVGVKTKE